MNNNLSISIVSPITGKDLTNGTLPNEWNTLHANYRHGSRLIIPYCQKFNRDDVVTIPVSSSSDVLPTMRAYDGAVLIETINGELARTITGTAGTVSHFNLQIAFGSDYYEKEIDLYIYQGSDVLTLEPVFITDLTEDLNNGVIKKIEYTNYNRVNTDLFGFFVDWGYLNSNVDRTLFFYVEAQNVDMNDEDEKEILTGSDKKTLISATYFNGNILAVDPVPRYMIQRLKAVTMLDFFAIQGIKYSNETSVEKERFGETTSFQAKINLIETQALGINVNSQGADTIMSDPIKYIVPVSKLGQVSGFDIEIPAGYMLHAIHANHTATSSGNLATLSAGTTAGGTDLIDPYNGEIDQINKTFSFDVHYRPLNGAAGRLYVGIDGVGVKLDVVVLFDYATDDAANPTPPTPPEPSVFTDLIKGGSSNLVQGNNTITFAKPFADDRYKFDADGYVGIEDVKVYRVSQDKDKVVVYVPTACVIRWSAIKY